MQQNFRPVKIRSICRQEFHHGQNDKVENIIKKGENAGNLHFLTMFSKAF